MKIFLSIIQFYSVSREKISHIIKRMMFPKLSASASRNLSII